MTRGLAILQICNIFSCTDACGLRPDSYALLLDTLGLIIA